jgi:hypothetical protein
MHRRSNSLYRCQVTPYLSRQLANGFARFILTGIWSPFKIIEHLGHICAVVLFITTKHRDLWLAKKKSNCKKTQYLLFWTAKYACIKPYFRSCLTEGSRADVSLLKPHISWTPDELCSKRAAAYIALTANKWIEGYSLSRFPSVSNCRGKSSPRQRKCSPALNTNFYWAYCVTSSRNMSRTFGLEVF